MRFTCNDQIKRLWNEIHGDWFARERMLDEDPRSQLGEELPQGRRCRPCVSADIRRAGGAEQSAPPAACGRRSGGDAAMLVAVPGRWDRVEAVAEQVSP